MCLMVGDVALNSIKKIKAIIGNYSFKFQKKKNSVKNFQKFKKNLK